MAVTLVRSTVYCVAETAVTDKPASDTGLPPRIKDRSLMSTFTTACVKLIVTSPAGVLRGSGVTSTMSARGTSSSIVVTFTA